MSDTNMLATLMAKMEELQKQQELQKLENEQLKLNQDALKKENERLSEELKKKGQRKRKEFKQLIHADNFVSLPDLTYSQVSNFKFIPQDMDERTAFTEFVVKQALYINKVLRTIFRCIVFYEADETVQWGILFLDSQTLEAQGLEIGWKQESGTWHVSYGNSLMPTEYNWNSNSQKEIGSLYANYLLKNNKSGILGISDVMIARLLLFGAEDIIFQFSSSLMTTIPQSKLGQKRGRQSGEQIVQQLIAINQKHDDSAEMEEESDSSKKKSKV